MRALIFTSFLLLVFFFVLDYLSGFNTIVLSLQRVHCGCIVSAYAFALLDAGGILCIACSRKNAVLVSVDNFTMLFQLKLLLLKIRA